MISEEEIIEEFIEEAHDKPLTICEQCGKSFSNIYTLKAHLKTVHERIKNFSCLESECHKRFSTKYKLRRHHQGVHSSTRLFNCEKCNAFFKTKDMVNKHSRIHYKGLDHHRKLKHRLGEAVVKAQRKNKERSVETVSMERAKENGQDCLWIQVKESKGPPIGEEIITDEAVEKIGDSDVVCDVCGRIFKRASSLKRHRARIHGSISDFRFTCSICHKRFLIKYELQRHKATHENTKALKCQFCDKKFKSKGSLDGHHRTVHVKKSPSNKSFKCNLCFRAYFHERHLAYHMRTHTNERLYKCDDCTQTFLYSDAVKWHRIRSHKDPAPFICKICDRKFIHRKALETHKLEHNKHDGSLAVYCPVCNKKISEKRHLKRHLRSHSEKSFNCSYCSEAFKERHMLKK